MIWKENILFQIFKIGIAENLNTAIIYANFL